MQMRTKSDDDGQRMDAGSRVLVDDMECTWRWRELAILLWTITPHTSLHRHCVYRVQASSAQHPESRSRHHITPLNPMTALFQSSSRAYCTHVHPVKRRQKEMSMPWRSSATPFGAAHPMKVPPLYPSMLVGEHVVSLRRALLNSGCVLSLRVPPHSSSHSFPLRVFLRQVGEISLKIELRVQRVLVG